jgi:hypothetical protein
LLLACFKCLLCASDHKNLDDINEDDLEDGDDEETDEDADILRSCKAEDFETRERRAFAAAVLDRPEQLMMYAQSTNDVSDNIHA